MLWYNLIFLITVTLSTPVIVILSGTINYYCDYFKSIFEDDISNQVFDFIVVGSGSAGAVVATRLSKNYKVLLLEAGGDPSFLNSVPGLARDLIGYSQTDWGYKSEPQRNAFLGLKNRQAPFNRGKVLGGTSTVNYLLYMRGHPNDYNNWANITGDPGWNYENVLPFFKKSIANYKGKYQDNAHKDKYYGSSPYGFLTIESNNFSPMKDEFRRAGKEMGYAEIDVNGRQTTGFGECEMTTVNGVRGGTYTTLLKNPRNPHNLQISKYSQAVKIHIDKSGRAAGVWYYRHGKKKYAVVSKEVISSAGSIDSPKLLMLSGIGPKAHLKKIGIKTRMDLPVGKNLQDHVRTTVFPFVIDKPLSFLPERNLTLGVFAEYFLHGTGPLAVGLLANIQAFLSTQFVNNKRSGDWPDIQIIFLPVAAASARSDSFSKVSNYIDGYLNEIIGPHDLKDGFQAIVLLARPKSRGEVTLKDKNPFSDPVMDPHYLEHPDDSKTLIEGIKFVLKMVESTKTFQEIGAVYTKVSVPDCKDFEFRSDAYWDCYLRYNTGTIYHYVSTCRMGKDISDPQAVVDSRLRVFGVSGLRVIDASIMPTIVNANTNAPAIMIGEKGSYFILDYWASQYLVSDKRQHFLYSDSRKCFYSRLV